MKSFSGVLDLNFFDPNVLLEKNFNNSKQRVLHTIRKALSIIMMGWSRDDWGDLASWRVFSAVFFSRDDELLRCMRLAFQEGFKHLYQQLKDKKLTPIEQRQVDLYLSNCLSFLPFSDITPYESIEIPQLIGEKWVLVDYKVVPIELTPTSGFEKFFTGEKDRVFAYGLEPICSVEAEPHLIFMGTTYPAGQGFFSQIYTDLEAFATAGNKLYESGRGRITNWIEKQNKKIHVCGISLGGSLALLLAIDQGNKLSRVDALNPAGLHDFLGKKIARDRWGSFSVAERPPVYIQKQGGDLVSNFGSWKKEWDVLQVNPPLNKQGPNVWVDHALNYAGFLGTRFTHVNAQDDNNNRFWSNIFISIARSIVYYSLIVPMHYVLRPLVSYTVGQLWREKARDVPICHHEKLPRNALMNLYTNEITETFTLKELGKYHYIKHALGQSDDTKLAGLSKQDILEQSLASASKDKNIVVTASKAKICDIKQSLRLFAHGVKLGKASEVLSAELSQQHQAYMAGL